MTETTPITGVRPEVIYGAAPMDDAKAAGAFGRDFNAEAGVLYCGILLPVGIVGVLKKLKENARNIPKYATESSPKINPLIAIII